MNMMNGGACVIQNFTRFDSIITEVLCFNSLFFYFLENIYIYAFTFDIFHRRGDCTVGGNSL